jgi:hypothetical protein
LNLETSIAFESTASVQEKRIRKEADAPVPMPTAEIEPLKKQQPISERTKQIIAQARAQQKQVK